MQQRLFLAEFGVQCLAEFGMQVFSWGYSIECASAPTRSLVVHCLKCLLSRPSLSVNMSVNLFVGVGGTHGSSVFVFCVGGCVGNLEEKDRKSVE